MTRQKKKGFLRGLTGYYTWVPSSFWNTLQFRVQRQATIGLCTQRSAYRAALWMAARDLPGMHLRLWTVPITELKLLETDPPTYTYVRLD